MKIIEANVTTGEIIERHMTQEEIAAAQAQYAAWLTEQQRPPISVTARQARLALLNAGLLESVENAVKSAGGAVAIEWEYATTIERTSPLVAEIATQLNLTEQQLDQLFIQASKY